MLSASRNHNHFDMQPQVGVGSSGRTDDSKSASCAMLCTQSRDVGSKHIQPLLTTWTEWRTTVLDVPQRLLMVLSSDRRALATSSHASAAWRGCRVCGSTATRPAAAAWRGPWRCQPRSRCWLSAWRPVENFGGGKRNGVPDERRRPAQLLNGAGGAPG